MRKSALITIGTQLAHRLSVAKRVRQGVTCARFVAIGGSMSATGEQAEGWPASSCRARQASSHFCISAISLVWLTMIASARFDTRGLQPIAFTFLAMTTAPSWCSIMSRR